MSGSSSSKITDSLDPEVQSSGEITAGGGGRPRTEESRWHTVCTLAKLKRQRRLHTQIDGRYISLFFDSRPQASSSESPSIYCLDSICYHMGGPLTSGDIEEIDGIPCLSCPWHKYKIDLRDGTRLSRPVTFDPKTRRPIPGKWESGPRCVQRVHDVRCTEDGRVEVRILEDGQVLSDKYAYSSRAARNLVGKATPFEPMDSSRPSSHAAEQSDVHRNSKRRMCTSPPGD
ncbi:hypothetical protein FOZ61_007831 [Perkinsus olseni]|uniref:Rieske domain-containing protein n=1 Tax=Perkinsus olseni TaxID=32597 RepID=A0A7J6M1K0_PEROL|nr:hypothetical protein FOZ61_007831 [Perkinsus olseni]KAF4665438.1 hypothetical protein FOL46_003689 [Perkinsus olseni]